MKQYQPCRFEASDRRGGASSRSRDRALGFPGLECIHCKNKRYFPISEKKFGDTTNLMMTHITNCTSAPLEVKASLCYLQHRSLLQKAELSGIWKLSFFKRVWDRLHHKNWNGDILSTENVSVEKEYEQQLPEDTARTDEVIDDNMSDAEDSNVDLKESHKLTPDTDTENTDALEEMKDLIKAAALWLCERDVELDARTRAGRGRGFFQTSKHLGRGGRGRGGRGGRREGF